ncbi:MAG: FRG domain-containing protein [Candidatus Wallbacteria bacterium]|nr:FRG domain-containing protein [Candidatus Wallbacteria bacterium]
MIQNFIIEKLEDFFKVFAELEWNTENFIFRGVSNHEYELLPKIFRNGFTSDEEKRHFIDTHEYNAEREMKIYKTWKKKAYSYLNSYNIVNQWERLAIAQHYGLCTRLLDWTRNPMVAAYFAVNSQSVEDCAIWALSFTDSDYIDKSYYDQDIDSFSGFFLFQPIDTDRRITAQNSIFSAQSFPISITNFFNEGEPADLQRLKKYKEEQRFLQTSTLIKIVIKNELKNKLYRVLLSWGINKGNLFPGLEGVSSGLTEQIKELKFF